MTDTAQLTSAALVATRAFPIPDADSVRYGAGAFVSIGELVEQVGGRRVFAVLSGSLIGSPVEAELHRRLGSRLVGQRARTPRHVPKHAVLETAEGARASRANCLVSIGGGSSIDCAKAVALCLASGVHTAEDFDRHRTHSRPTAPAPPVNGALLPHIAVPSTLSGGEHTAVAGVTDEATRTKGIYTAPGLAPRVIVLDPVVTAGTPGWLWAATGMRAVDHAVEGILSTRSTPITEVLGLEALRLLAANLAHSARHPDDVTARTNCLLATWMSAVVLLNAGGGLSHAIGHQLGPEFGLLHGHTSAIMLPPVLEFLAAETAPKQRRIAAALGAATDGLDDTAAAAAAARVLREVISGLDLPGALSAVGASRDRLPTVAAHALDDPTIAAAPRPVSQAELESLLEVAW